MNATSDNANGALRLGRPVATWLAALLGALLGLGCAATYPPAPKEIASVEYDYIIGPGDTINIIVWRNPELSMVVPVRPDGKLTAPLIDDLPAQGKTPTALARDVEKSLAKFIREPVVSVIVTAFAGPVSDQVRVIGEAAKPQALPYREQMSLLDVMIQVGGLTPFAAGNRSLLVRRVDGEERTFQVNIDKLLKYGDLSQNVRMLPGDVLVVPQAWF